MNTILFDATGGKGWVGGVYYKNNILYSLTQNEEIMKNNRFLVVTNAEFKSLFEYPTSNIRVKCIKYKSRRVKQLKILLLSIIHHCKYLYHGSENYYSFLGKIMIRWIPDFQHNCLPEFFSEKEIDERNAEFQRIAKQNEPIVLSSNDAYETYCKKYDGVEKAHVFVVPFVSYITPILDRITNRREQECLEKFDVEPNRYVCVMNQFWKHKNHVVVLKALEMLYESYPEDNFSYVFTGELNDYRNPDYIQQIEELLQKPVIKEHVKMLGFIEREEQLALMKNAAYVIQPSLFEGWGTVVEDAKVLDKTVLLSDIPVHREQKNEKCMLFDPFNAEMLANMIYNENKKPHFDDLKKGKEDMQRRAKEYSREFQKILEMKK